MRRAAVALDAFSVGGIAVCSIDNSVLLMVHHGATQRDSTALSTGTLINVRLSSTRVFSPGGIKQNDA